jgi:ABC-type glycerol-3-phosphate transport system permease component
VASTPLRAPTSERSARPRWLSSRRFANATTVVALVLGALFILLPLFWIVDTAFKPEGQAFVIPPKFVYRPSPTSSLSSTGHTASSSPTWDIRW